MIYYGGFLYKAGGVGSHVKAIEKEMYRQGWHVISISLESLPIWCRYVPHLVEKAANFFNRPIGFFYKGACTKALYRIFFSKKVDIRIFEDVYIAWDSKTPSVTVLHAVWSDNLQAYSLSAKQEGKLKKYEAEVIENIRHPVVTVSYPYKHYIDNSHFPYPLAKEIEVVELGIDQSSFHDFAERTKKSIVYCGTLEARKNVLFLLEVFKRLSIIDPEYSLTIIGDGPDRKELTEFAEINGLTVNFLGRLNHANVIAELHRHDIYLHTSVKESFSYSLLEAKLAGLKTCAYAKLQVPAEFIDLAIDTFDENDWCSKILDNNNCTPKVINVDNYTIEKMTLSTLNLAR
jgi:glycosyltransferase involved in cell wall biosynthesis